MSNAKITPTIMQVIIPCKIELFDPFKSFSPISLEITELVPMPRASPNLEINTIKGCATPNAKNAS